MKSIVENAQPEFKSVGKQNFSKRLKNSFKSVDTMGALMSFDIGRGLSDDVFRGVLKTGDRTRRENIGVRRNERIT